MSFKECAHPGCGSIVQGQDGAAYCIEHRKPKKPLTEQPVVEGDAITEDHTSVIDTDQMPMGSRIVCCHSGCKVTLIKSRKNQKYCLDHQGKTAERTRARMLAKGYVYTRTNPVTGSLWDETMRQVIKESRAEGKEGINFADIDKRVINISKMITSWGERRGQQDDILKG